MASVVHSKLLYAALVWASALSNRAIEKKLFPAQRGAALRIVSAYRIVSNLCCVGEGKAKDMAVEMTRLTDLLTPETMVPLILQSGGVWKHIESFIILVMRTKDIDGRKEHSNGDGQ